MRLTTLLVCCLVITACGERLPGHGSRRGRDEQVQSLVGTYRLDWRASGWLEAANAANRRVPTDGLARSEAEFGVPVAPLEDYQCWIRLEHDGSFHASGNGMMWVMPRAMLIGERIVVEKEPFIDARLMLMPFEWVGTWKEGVEKVILAFSTEDGTFSYELGIRPDRRALRWREDELGEIWLGRTN